MDRIPRLHLRLPIPRRSRSASVALAAALCASCVLASEIESVDANVLRGAHPSAEVLSELARRHVRLVVDLRQASRATDEERAAVTRLGMRYLNLPWKPVGAPTQEQARRVLALLEDPAAGPIFVHCRRGKDRTGTAIACYRIEHDGWSQHQALQEARDTA